MEMVTGTKQAPHGKDVDDVMDAIGKDNPSLGSVLPTVFT